MDPRTASFPAETLGCVWPAVLLLLLLLLTTTIYYYYYYYYYYCYYYCGAACSACLLLQEMKRLSATLPACGPRLRDFHRDSGAHIVMDSLSTLLDSALIKAVRYQWHDALYSLPILSCSLLQLCDHRCHVATGATGKREAIILVTEATTVCPTANVAHNAGAPPNAGGP